MGLQQPGGRGRAESGLGGPASDPAGVGGCGVRLLAVRTVCSVLTTRAAIRRWQSSRGARATGYLDGASAAALRTAGGAGPAVAAAAASAPFPSPAAQTPSPASSQVEVVFWQSIANSTNPAEFEAYLAQFPNGVFRALAQARLAALRSPSNQRPASSGSAGSRVSGVAALAFGTAAGGDVVRRPGEVFRDCPECPEMVVLPGGNLAMGRYEVTVGEYRAFASAAGGGAGGGCIAFGDGDSWRDPGFPQTDRHPVTCVSWDDAQAYVSWLSRTTGMAYRVPTEAEWERAAAGSQPGCDRLGLGTRPDGTCPVGSHGSNAAGLSDMVGNLWEWTSDCWQGNCGLRVVRGGSWSLSAELLRLGARLWIPAGNRYDVRGFRVSRTLD